VGRRVHRRVDVQGLIALVELLVLVKLSSLETAEVLLGIASAWSFARALDFVGSCAVSRMDLRFLPRLLLRLLMLLVSVASGSTSGGLYASTRPCCPLVEHWPTFLGAIGVIF
jgi:hypothetical protein